MPPEKTPARDARVHLVEACRGLAALQVLLFHLVEIYEPAAPGTLGAYLLLPFSFGREAVIVFFILSGFSIHYASMDRDLASRTGVRDFLLLRGVRLYPILAVAVLMTLMLIILGDALALPAYEGLMNWQSLRSGLLSLLFLTDMHSTQGAWFFTPPTNPSLWSLAYEAVYYVLYPVFWLGVRRYGIHAATSAGIGISVLAAVLSATWGADHLLNVLQLYAIWCVGAVLAHYHRQGALLRPSPTWALVVAVVLLCLRTALRDVLPRVAMDWAFAGAFFIPCFAFLTARESANSSRPRDAMLVVAAVSCCVVALAAVLQADFYSGSTRLLIVKTIVAVVLILLTVLARPSDGLPRAGVRLVLVFAPLGGISYALYVLHYPLLRFARSALGPQLGEIASALFAVAVVATLACLLERWMQPWLATPVRRKLHRSLQAMTR